MSRVAPELLTPVRPVVFGRTGAIFGCTPQALPAGGVGIAGWGNVPIPPCSVQTSSRSVAFEFCLVAWCRSLGME